MGSAVSTAWESGDADSGVAFVAEVHADEQGGDQLDDPGVFKFSAVDAADARNLCRQFAGELCGIGIVAANDDVAVERGVGAEQVGGNVVEGGDHADFFGHEFGCLLGRGALPDAKSARGASADADCEGYGSVDEMLPAVIADFSFLRSEAWPSKGTVSIRMSEAAQAALFSMPDILAWPPSLCWMAAAACCARFSSREPMMMVSPARAQRRASPMPAGPVPPMTAIGRMPAGLEFMRIQPRATVRRYIHPAEL